MKKLLGSLFLLLTACAPTTVPQSEPVYYLGLAADVYARVVEVISTSPGLENSEGWIITQSDAAGYFIRAETRVTPVVLGVPMPSLIAQKSSESVSVIVAQQEDKAQVIIQFTQAARPLADFIKQVLDTKFMLAGQLGEKRN